MSAAAIIDDALSRARAAVETIVDPEIPVLTIADLGILRDLSVDERGVHVAITPTYSGCPAMNVIAFDIEVALNQAGFENVRVETVLSPAWTTDWLTDEGRAKLIAYGIAPPGKATGRRALFGVDLVKCPRCASMHTSRLAEFGSTSCKALWRCETCREPFDYFRCH